MKTPDSSRFKPDPSFTFGLARILGIYFDRKILDLVVEKKGEKFVAHLASSYQSQLNDAEGDPIKQERIKAQLVVTLEHFAKE